MYEEYSSIVFVDAMVVLEGRPLDQLPWDEIDAEGPILLCFVPQVCKEIDQRKRDGRLGKHARAFNRLMTPAAETGVPQTISEGTPRVDLTLAVTNRVDWDQLDDLDPDEGDARVIAQVLNERNTQFESRMFLSHDINPIGMASRHGIKTKKMPDSWLRSPEPSPQQKEVTRLKGRVRELEAKEPEIAVKVNFGTSDEFEHVVVSEIETDKKTLLREAIISDHPRKSQNQSGMLAMSLMKDSEYDGKFDVWRKRTIPRFVESLSNDINNMYGQTPIQIAVSNDGSIQAEDLVLNVKIDGGTISNVWSVVPNYPFPPQPQPYSPLHAMGNHNILSGLKTRMVGRHEMDFDIDADGGTEFEVHCQDFRHGRVWEFEGVLMVDWTLSSDLEISVTTTASNMRGQRKFDFSLKHVPRPKALKEVYDLEKREFVLDRPMEKILEAAAREQDFSSFKIISYDDE